MSLANIDQAFINEFINQSFGLPIAHENIDFTPTAGTAFVSLRLLSNDVTPLSYTESDETDGIFRIILNWPAGKGSIQAKNKADEILAAFNIGTRLSYSGQYLTVTSASREQGESIDGWYRIIISIAYYAVIDK